MRHSICFLIILSLTSPAFAKNTGLGFIIWSALTRPDTSSQAGFICSNHTKFTMFSVQLYDQRVSIYRNTGEGDQVCAPITESEQFLKDNPSVQTYIDNAYASISSRYNDVSGLSFNLMFNAKVPFKKESLFAKFLNSFSLDAHAEPIPWSIQLIVSQKQGNQNVDIDHIPMN